MVVEPNERIVAFIADVREDILHNTIPSENDFRELLINRIVNMFFCLSVILFPMTMIRAWNTGISYLEIVYSILFIFVAVLAFLRNRIATRSKVIFITSIALTIATAGFYTMGMLAGAVFFFTLAGVIFALFFSKKTVIIYKILLTIFLISIAIGFSSHLLEIKSGADALLSSSTHWIIYILSFSLIMTIICITILNYRQELKLLIENLHYQREKMEEKNIDLNKALDEIRTLRGILPLCSYCKKIRDDKGYWEQVDVYIHKHTNADISHSICPDCMKKYHPNTVSKKTVNNNTE